VYATTDFGPPAEGELRLGTGPVKPDLVLHVDRGGIRCIDRPRRSPVAVDVALPDAPPHLGPVRSQHRGLVDGGDTAGRPRISNAHRGDEVGGERRNPAPARDGGRDEGYADGSLTIRS